MKKLLLVTLMILVTLCASASAEKEIYPFHLLDMETYGEGTSTVSAMIHPDQIDENGCMTYEVYDLDLYKTEEVLALEPGDKVCVYNEMMTVEKVSCKDSEIYINGGFFFEENEEGKEGEQGATLWMVEEDPTVCVAVMYEDLNETMIGQASFPLANPVTVISFQWGEDGNWNGEYDVAEVAPADFADYMQKLKENDVSYDAGCTALTLTDGLITEIRIEWHP